MTINSCWVPMAVNLRSRELSVAGIQHDLSVVGTERQSTCVGVNM